MDPAEKRKMLDDLESGSQALRDWQQARAVFAPSTPSMAMRRSRRAKPSALISSRPRFEARSPPAARMWTGVNSPVNC